MIQQITLNNNVSLSSIVAGCMRIADAKSTDQQIVSFVNDCLAMGIDSFDHAPVYGGYTVEERFGQAVLKQTPSLRDKIKLISKTGIVLPNYDSNNTTIYYRNTANWIIPEVERSLKKLHTDHLDVLLVHRFDPLANPLELGETLDRLVREGKTKSVGVSNYTPTAFAALRKHMKEPLVTNQVEISAKSPDILFNDLGDDALLRGLPLMAWSPLGGGSLLNGTDEQSIRIQKQIESIAKQYDTTPDVILYAWVLRLPQEIMLVTGTMNTQRIQSALKATDITLTYDEWYRILAASRGFDVP